MKGGGLCPDLSFKYQGTEFTPYTWGSDGGVASMFGDSRCGFFIEVGDPAEGDTPRNDYFINIKNDSKRGGVPQIEQITSQTTKLEGNKKINISDLKLDMEKNPIENLDNYFEEVEKQSYSVIQFDGTIMTRFKPPPPPTVVEDESKEETTDVEGDRFTIKQDIEKVTHKGVDVLKAVGPVRLEPNTEEKKTEEIVGEIVNKDSVAKVLCLPISKVLGSAKETKELYNLSDNSRKLKEIEEEEKGLTATRGTEHLQAKKEALKTSLKKLAEKDGITGMNLAKVKDGDLNDSLINYNKIKTNLENSRPVLQDLEDPLPMQIYEMINGSREPMVLEGDALYKFCDAIQKKVDGLINALENVTKFEKINGILTVFKTRKKVGRERMDTITSMPFFPDFIKQIQSYYLTPENLEISGSMADRSQEEKKSDRARESEKKRINRQRDFGKAANTFRKGVGNASKGLMSYFTNTKKNQKEEGTAAEEVPANTTGGGKRKTRKNKARKTRRKVQRKRRQSKKH